MDQNYIYIFFFLDPLIEFKLRTAEIHYKGRISMDLERQRLSDLIDSLLFPLLEHFWYSDF